MNALLHPAWDAALMFVLSSLSFWAGFAWRAHVWPRVMGDKP